MGTKATRETKLADLYSGEQEAAFLEAEQRFVLSGVEQEEISGLAISGGGIRSAAFALGVLQSLVAAGELRRFHYLSSVSGGGYLASSLTYFLEFGLPTKSPCPAGLEAENFPFGARAAPSTVEGDERERVETQNRILDYIRQHSTYLTPTPALGLVSLAAVVLRSAFLSLSVYFSLLVGCLGGLLELGAMKCPGFLPPFRWLQMIAGNWLLFVASLMGLFLAALAVFYALFTRVFPGPSGYHFRTKVQLALGRLFSLGFALALVGTLPHWLTLVEYAAPAALGTAQGAAGTLAVFAGASSAFLGTVMGALVKPDEAAFRFLPNLRPLLAAWLVLSGLLLSAFAVAVIVSASPHRAIGYGLFLGFGGILGWASNLNYLGAHRMYRDRLMELFLPDAQAVRTGRWCLAPLADRLGLHEVGGVKQGKVKRPYPLINTNVVLVDSGHSRERGRGGDSFVLSPLYAGSRATGWARTEQLGGNDKNYGLSLASAMATSGAAVNPHTGPSGGGMLRTLPVSLLLRLLNLRLGYFVPNPRKSGGRVPNFLVPGLSVLLGRGLSEGSSVLELSDGGHFENLGVYELIRRKAKFILVSDGAQDEDYQHADLSHAVERVRVDFGAKIEFDEAFGLDGLTPREDLRELGIPLSTRPFALARIRYPGDAKDTPSGTLIYIKSCLFPGLPADVLGYRKARPAFPHQSTGDQFFDERQFEAYRELGYYAGWKYLEARPEKGA